MKSLSEILLEKLKVTEYSPIDKEYDNFIEKEWIDMNIRYSLTYFKQVEIPNIFKLVLKDPDTWYNIIKFDIKFAYNFENGNAYSPKIMFTLGNDKSNSKQITLFIDAEKTRLVNLNNINDIEDFLAHDFYEEIKIDTINNFISFLKEAIRFHVSPTSKGNTMDIIW